MDKKKESYYKILGVGEKASLEEIKQAYKKLALVNDVYPLPN
jgi:curved DNA-binding protein CbpA